MIIITQCIREKLCKYRKQLSRGDQCLDTIIAIVGDSCIVSMFKKTSSCISIISFSINTKKCFFLLIGQYHFKVSQSSFIMSTNNQVLLNQILSTAGKFLSKSHLTSMTSGVTSYSKSFSALQCCLETFSDVFFFFSNCSIFMCLVVL